MNTMSSASTLQSQFIASSHRLTRQLWNQLEARPRIHVEDLAAAVVLLQLLQLVVHHARSRAASHWSLRWCAWAAYYLPVPLAALAAAVMVRFPCPCWLVAVFFAGGQADTMAAYSLRDTETQSLRRLANRGLSLAFLALALFHADGGGAVARLYLRLRPKDIFFLLMGFRVVRQGLKVSRSAMIPPSEICKVAADHVRLFRARSPSTVVVDDDDDDDDDHQSPQAQPSVVAVGSLDSYQSAVSGCTTLEDIETNLPARRRRHQLRLLRYGDASLSSALFLQLLQRYAGGNHGGAPPLELSSANHAFRDVVAGPFGLGWKAAFKVVEAQLRFLHDLFFSAHGSPSITAYILYRDYAVFKIGFLLSVIGLATHDDEEQSFDTTCAAIGLCLPLVVIEVCHFIGVATSDRVVVSLMCETKRDLAGLAAMARGASTDVVEAKLELVLERLGLNKVQLGQYSLVEEFDWCSSPLKQIWLMGRRRTPPEQGTPSSEDWSRQFEQLQNWICNKAESRSAASRFAFDDGASMFVRASGPAANTAAAAALSWALRQKTTIHTILVWHVAAWFCDMSEHERGLRYREPGRVFPPSEHIFAMMLSNYCAYLVAFRPELLGEHPALTASVFQAAAKELADLGYGGLPSPGQRHAKMARALKALQVAADDADAGVIQQGVRLGGQLVARGDGSYESYMERWEVMEDFWGEMVLHVARSGGDAAAHVECLADGGEFVTKLWALLSNGRWEDGAKTTMMATGSSGTMMHFKLRVQ